MKLNTVSQIFIIVAGLLVLGALIFVFIVFPLFDEIRAGATLWVEDQKRLLAFDRTEQETAKLADEVSRIEEIDPLMQKTLIQKDGAIEFIVSLETIGKALKLSYDIGIGATEPLGRGVAAHSFQISLTGPYLSVARFIEAVEQMPHYTKVQSVGMSRRGNEVSASLIVSAFAHQ